MKAYRTEEAAFKRQHTLFETYGVMSGVHRVGDHWELIYDDDRLYQDRKIAVTKDVPAEYVESKVGPDSDAITDDDGNWMPADQRFDWLPDDYFD